MSAIQDDARSVRDQLQSSRPDRRGQTVSNRIFGGVTESFSSRDSQGRVGRLVVADQRKAEVPILEARAHHCQRVALPSLGSCYKLDLAAQSPDGCSDLLGLLLNDLERHSFAASDHVVSRLDDRRFFMSDLLDRVT